MLESFSEEEIKQTLEMYGEKELVGIGDGKENRAGYQVQGEKKEINGRKREAFFKMYQRPGAGGGPMESMGITAEITKQWGIQSLKKQHLVVKRTPSGEISTATHPQNP